MKCLRDNYHTMKLFENEMSHYAGISFFIFNGVEISARIFIYFNNLLKLSGHRMPVHSIMITLKNNEQI